MVQLANEKTAIILYETFEQYSNNLVVTVCIWYIALPGVASITPTTILNKTFNVTSILVDKRFHGV